MLFRVALFQALRQSDLSQADRSLLLHYAIFPRMHGVVDGKPCIVDMMEEAEAEMTRAAVAEGRVVPGGNINWSQLLDWLVKNLPQIIAADFGAGGGFRGPELSSRARSRR